MDDTMIRYIVNESVRRFLVEGVCDRIIDEYDQFIKDVFVPVMDKYQEIQDDYLYSGVYDGEERIKIDYPEFYEEYVNVMRKYTEKNKKLKVANKLIANRDNKDGIKTINRNQTKSVSDLFYESAKYIVEKNGFTELNPIGKGAFAYAFRVGDGYILKVTMNNQTYESWRKIHKLKGNKLRHIAKIYDVGIVPENVTEGSSRNIGYCIQEEVTPPSEQESEDYRLISRTIDRMSQNGSLYGMIENLMYNNNKYGYKTDISKFVDEIYKKAINPETYKFLIVHNEDLSEFVRRNSDFIITYIDTTFELAKIGLGYDMHAGNFGMNKHGEMVFYDV